MSVKASKKESRTSSSSRERRKERDRDCREERSNVEVTWKTLRNNIDDRSGTGTRKVYPDPDNNDEERACKKRSRLEGRKEGSEGKSHRSERSSRYRSRSRSRDEDRDMSSRHEQRKRRQAKKRQRGRSSSSSMSRSRSRSRSRSSKARRSGRRQRRSNGSSSDRDYHNTSQYDSYKYQEPNNTVMIRSLASHLTEKDIREDLLQSEIPVKDIRLIKDHETGVSRGFAFVEFHCVADATRWIEMKKGLLVLQNFQSSLIYSIPKIPSSEGNSKLPTDWDCQNCYASNFKRREFCYKCKVPKPEEAEYGEISYRPTSTIVLSNLDILTTEEGVLQAFQSKPGMASIPIKSVKIIREADTCMSTGKCCVQANNVPDATNLLSNVLMDVFEIDGRIVSAAYGKSVNHGKLQKNSNVAATALAAARWTNNIMKETDVAATGPPCTDTKEEVDVESIAIYYAQLYAKTADEYSCYLRYYRQYYFQEMAKETSLRNSDPKSRGLHHLKLHQPVHPGTVVAASGSQTSFEWSDRQSIVSDQDSRGMKSYQYDETNGCYFDSDSGVYFNPENQQFFYCSHEGRKYVAVSSSCNGIEEAQKGMKTDKQDKLKEAKLIAKEMEKWAKHFNQKKCVSKQSSPKNSILASELSSTLTAELRPSILSPKSSTFSSKKAVDESGAIINKCVRISPESESSRIPTLASVSKTESDQLNLPVIRAGTQEFKLIDEDKLVCLLCKRRFTNIDLLQKHVTISDMHKNNLKAIRQVPENCLADSHPVETSKSMYRDRAKERRDQFGSEKDVSNDLLKNLYMGAKVEAAKSPDNSIKEDNIGSRMLQRMGWHEGQGLGLNNQGRVDIIKTQYHTGKLGLGIKAPESIDEKLDSQSRARRITFARYQELE